MRATRAEAIARLRRCAGRDASWTASRPPCRCIARSCEDPEFQAGDYTIHWLERFVGASRLHQGSRQADRQRRAFRWRSGRRLADRARHDRLLSWRRCRGLVPAPRRRAGRRTSRRHIDITPELMLRAYRAGLFPMAESRRRRPALLAGPGAARRHPAGPWLPPAEAAAAHRPLRPLPGYRRCRFRRHHRRLRRRRPGAGGHLDQSRDRVPLRRPASPGPCPFGRGLGGRAPGRRPLWRGARRRLLRREHVQPRRGTPPRWRWCIWWRGCGWAASPCSTASS